VVLVAAAAGDHVDDSAVLRPNSASKLLVMTRNSCAESGLAEEMPDWPPGTEVSLLSDPSSMKLLLRSRWPLTENPPMLLAAVTTPGESRTSW